MAVIREAVLSIGDGFKVAFKRDTDRITIMLRTKLAAFEPPVLVDTVYSLSIEEANALRYFLAEEIGDG